MLHYFYTFWTGFHTHLTPDFYTNWRHRLESVWRCGWKNCESCKCTHAIFMPLGSYSCEREGGKRSSSRRSYSPCTCSTWNVSATFLYKLCFWSQVAIASLWRGTRPCPCFLDPDSRSANCRGKKAQFSRVSRFLTDAHHFKCLEETQAKL